MATTATKQSKTASKAPAPLEPDTDLDEAAPPKKKRGLLKTLLLLTLLLGGAGGAAWYFLGEQQSEAATKPGVAKAATGKTAKAKAAASKPPVFVTLEPFTVNLQQDDTAPQYLQVGIALKVVDESYIEAINLYMPEIRNRVLLLLSSKKASEISTLEGKKTLSSELTKEIVQPLAGRVPAQGLDSVLFTSFVVQ